MSNQPNRSGRILIVEDEGIVATDIERCLADHGFEVTGIAATMADALREAARSRPDLVLMDIRIKGEGDGIVTADYLRRQYKLPIIYLTSHDDRDTIARAKRTEPMAFLLKPFKSAELTSAVEIALKRSWLEHEAQEREQSFLSAMDAIGDAVLTADSQGCIRFINRAAEELTGWRQENALGAKATDVVNIVKGQNTSVETFSALLDIVGVAPSDSGNEYCVLANDGVYRWLTIKATRIGGTGDGSIRVVVMQEITRQKQAENALRRQADLLDQSQEAIFTWDLNGAITYWNRGAQTLYRFSPQEAVGHAAAELLGSANDAALFAALARDYQWCGEVTRRTKDGCEITVESVMVVVCDAAGQKTILETDRDITERKANELEIRELNQELRTHVRNLTSANQELEAFNYSVAHDLRAPLRHIDGFSKILIEEHATGIPDAACRYLDLIRDGARRMGRMVDELLELSRTSRKEVARRPTGLKSLVDDVLADLRPELEGREIAWRIGDLPFMECDPTLTRQVFSNLLSNAVKFTRLRNLAVIEVGQTGRREQPVLFVRDNGVGFSLKYADKLFGVFQRLHRREDFEGTGVGLAMVQRIIHKHGGRIWVEAELNKGATFYFTLNPQGETIPEPESDETALVAGGK